MPVPLRLLLWQNKKKLWKGQGCSIFSWKIKLQLKKTTSLKGTFAKNFSKTLKSHVLELSISKIINDNRTFWKTILVHCTQKASKDEKINITKRERSSRTMKKFALLLTNVFKYVPYLNILAVEHSHWNFQNTYPILATVYFYDKHVSIKRIKNRSHCVKSVQILRISPYSVRTRENTDQEKLRIWTLFTQCHVIRRSVSEKPTLMKLAKSFMIWISKSLPK